MPTPKDQSQSLDQKTQRLLDIFSQISEPAQAALRAGDFSDDAVGRVLTLGTGDLGSDKLASSPFEISFPFQSFIVLDATDSTVKINMQLGNRNSVNDSFPLQRGTSLKMPYPVKRAFLSWTAQVGKTFTILFLIKGELATNVLNLVNSGGVSISEGSGFSHSQVTLAAATAGSIFAQNTQRKVSSFRNKSGASLWVGSSVVTSDSGATPGFEVLPGDVFEWRNSAQLYGYSVAGTTLTIFEET